MTAPKEFPAAKWNWEIGEVQKMQHWPILSVHVVGSKEGESTLNFRPCFQICGTDKDEMLAMAEKVKAALESGSRP